MEENENVLEARLIKRSMSPYAIPVIVVPRKSKSGAPLAEAKRLVTKNWTSKSLKYKQLKWLLSFN